MLNNSCGQLCHKTQDGGTWKSKIWNRSHFFVHLKDIFTFSSQLWNLVIISNNTGSICCKRGCSLTSRFTCVQIPIQRWIPRSYKIKTLCMVVTTRTGRQAYKGGDHKNHMRSLCRPVTYFLSCSHVQVHDNRNGSLSLSARHKSYCSSVFPKSVFLLRLILSVGFSYLVLKSMLLVSIHIFKLWCWLLILWTVGLQQILRKSLERKKTMTGTRHSVV